MDQPAAETIRVVDSGLACPELSIVVGGGSAKVVMWPGNGSRYRTFQLVTLDDGAATVTLEHPSDSVYYVMAGSGAVVDAHSGERMPLVEGAMIHIDAGDAYRLEADAGSGMKILGGPCPADERLYAALSPAAG
jgi:mannose-6-phosphate isomerase-like protein (cupin superfamily)